MWLLRTDTAELHYFARNFDAPGGYAILSHTWEGAEQTLQELRAIIERCRKAGTNPRDDAALSPKIRNCCILAEKNGYRWLWIDSCCIDKTSSSELSEAINSMYQWYKESEVCYAYLADVPRNDNLGARGSAFRCSRWHTRGWTLQELIAPDFLIFLSADWHELGNRAALAELLEDITEVPSKVLTGHMRPALYSACVRMSWASSRKTTRVEDEAYCLMGLFRVNMPTNYGEGKRAFIRLQYEIMQHSPDMSLFAFGSRVGHDHNFTFHPQEKPVNPWKYLLAVSPREFDFQVDDIPKLGTNAKQQYPPPPNLTVTGPFDDVELPRATVANYGVELRVPIYEADGITIAVLLCVGDGRNVGLFLTKDGTGKDPKRPRYFTTCVYSSPRTSGPARYVARMTDLGDDLYNLTFNGKPVQASWRTIYVVPTTSDFDSESTTTPNLILNCNPVCRFRVPRWLITRLVALQFEVCQIRNTEALQVVEILRRSPAIGIYVFLGSCAEHHDHDPDKPPVFWVKIDMKPHFVVDTFTHNCSEDHIDSESWVTRSKVFGDVDRNVRLSLTPSTRMSESVFEIHLELFGRIFEQMLKEAAISFPSLADLAKDRSRPSPRDPVTPFRPRTLAHESTSARNSSLTSSSWSPSPTSTASSHTRSSRIPRLAASPRGSDTQVQDRPQGSHDGLRTPDPDRRTASPRQGGGACPPQTHALAPASSRLRSAALKQRVTATRKGGQL